MRCQLCKPPYFYPARDGSNQKCPYFVLRPGRRQNQDQDGNTNRRGEETVNVQGDAEKRTSTTTRTGLQHEGPRGAEPTEQGQSSGAEGQARATWQETEVEYKPRVANATSGEDQRDCATHGEASEHIGIHTSSNAHPDCVKGDVKESAWCNRARRRASL